MRFGLVIPTLNAGPWLPLLVPAIQKQSVKPDRFIVMDSSSADQTAAVLAGVGAEVHTVQRTAFDHGGTRQDGVDLLGDLPVVLLLTQDAIPADEKAFEHLLRAFDDERVGLAYGRQLPREAAGSIEAHARVFNYRDASTTDFAASFKQRGIRAGFCSNSFAAYRVQALKAVGGFPRHCVFGEDMLAAIEMMQQGWVKRYVAEACVRHSHPYSIGQDFRRYFDIGAMHKMNAEKLGNFRGPSSEGVRFVKSELSYVARREPLSLPSVVMRTAAKYVGYRIGRAFDHLPPQARTRLGMNKSFWTPASGR